MRMSHTLWEHILPGVCKSVSEASTSAANVSRHAFIYYYLSKSSVENENFFAEGTRNYKKKKTKKITLP